MMDTERPVAWLSMRPTLSSNFVIRMTCSRRLLVDPPVLEAHLDMFLNTLTKHRRCAGYPLHGAPLQTNKSNALIIKTLMGLPAYCYIWQGS